MEISKSNCNHELCNEELEDGRQITAEEATFILDCCVEQGLISRVMVDGEPRYTASERVN